MEKNSIVFLLLICLMACSDKSNLIEDKIKSLETTADKIQFLEDINDEDQGVRTNPINDMDMLTMDDRNMQLIEAYLDTYGYPSIGKFSLKAASTPILVVHHHPDLYYREKYFDLFYSEYKKGNIQSTAYTFYLHRYNEKLNKSRCDIKGSFTEDFEIDTLFQLLKKTPKSYIKLNVQ